MSALGDGLCPCCENPLPLSGAGGYFHVGDCDDCERSGDGYTEPLPEDWPQRRGVVLERAGYQCERIVEGGRRCSARHDPPRSTLEVHHRLARRYSAEATDAGQDIHDLNNLVALCRQHHWSETQGELAAELDSSIDAVLGVLW